MYACTHTHAPPNPWRSSLNLPLSKMQGLPPAPPHGHGLAIVWAGQAVRVAVTRGPARTPPRQPVAGPGSAGVCVCVCVCVCAPVSCVCKLLCTSCVRAQFTMRVAKQAAPGTAHAPREHMCTNTHQQQGHTDWAFQAQLPHYQFISCAQDLTRAVTFSCSLHQGQLVADTMQARALDAACCCRVQWIGTSCGRARLRPAAACCCCLQKGGASCGCAWLQSAGDGLQLRSPCQHTACRRKPGRVAVRHPHTDAQRTMPNARPLRLVPGTRPLSPHPGAGAGVPGRPGQPGHLPRDGPCRCCHCTWHTAPAWSKGPPGTQGHALCHGAWGGKKKKERLRGQGMHHLHELREGDSWPAGLQAQRARSLSHLQQQQPCSDA